MQATRIIIRTLIASVAMLSVSLAEDGAGAKKMPTFSVDAAQHLGPFRPLNGVNGVT